MSSSGYLSSASFGSAVGARWRQPLTHPLPVREGCLILSPPVQSRAQQRRLKPAQMRSASIPLHARAEEHSPRTMQAYSDDVRVLAGCCRKQTSQMRLYVFATILVGFAAKQLGRLPP